MTLQEITECIPVSDAACNIYALERSPLAHIKEEYQAYISATTDLLVYTERLLNTMVFQVRADGASATGMLANRWCAHTQYLSNVFTGQTTHSWETWRSLLVPLLDIYAITPIKEANAEALSHDVACWCVTLNAFIADYNFFHVKKDVDQILMVAVKLVNKLSNGDWEAVKLPRAKK